MKACTDDVRIGDVIIYGIDYLGNPTIARGHCSSTGVMRVKGIHNDTQEPMCYLGHRLKRIYWNEVRAIYKAESILSMEDDL